MFCNLFSHPKPKHVPNGVSVHYLKTQFLHEVEEMESLNENSTIREIEDLRWAKHGVIRSKGASKGCPRDDTVGAASMLIA
eukprot:scaffold303_cov285-Chaetoceros_neogracile.AAC.3